MHRFRNCIPHEPTFVLTQPFELLPRLLRRASSSSVVILAELSVLRPLHRNQLVVQVRRAPCRVLGGLVLQNDKRAGTSASR
jgi:hypothetical protein